jgi:hypothetical protein
MWSINIEINFNKYFSKYNTFFDKSLSFIITLILGGFAGSLFLYLNIPLPWILGPIFCISIVSIIGVKTYVPEPLVLISQMVLGLVLGSNLDSNFFTHEIPWLESISLLLVCCILSTLACYNYLIFYRGYENTTAFFCSIPGGVQQIPQLGKQVGGDESTISLMHASHTLFTVLIIPIFIDLFFEIDNSKFNPLMFDQNPISNFDIFIMLISAISGYYLGIFLKVPGGVFLGPMVVFGYASITGITYASPTGSLNSLCQLLISASYGSLFIGSSFAKIRKILIDSVITSSIEIIIVIFSAIFLSYFSKLKSTNIIFAFTPGDTLEMTLFALSMGGDISFVMVLHFIREIAILILGPVIYGFFVLDDN